MLAKTARLARGSRAPAQGSLSTLAAPVRSPVDARVKRASQAHYTTAAPTRSASASLPRAAGRGNRTSCSRSRSPDFYVEPQDAVSFLEDTEEGVYHDLVIIEGTAPGDLNIPPELMDCFFVYDVLSVEGSSAKRLSVMRSPNMRMVSETKMCIPVITDVQRGGSRHRVACKNITGSVGSDGENVEFRAKDLEKCLIKTCAEPGDAVLVSMRDENNKVKMELRVMQQAAVTEEVLNAMERFLVPPKPRGQEAKKVGRVALCSTAGCAA